MNTVKMIVQWVLVAFFAVIALLWFPSLSTICFLLGAVILLPVKPLEELLEKYKLKFSTRIIIAVILLLVGFTVTPSDDEPSAEKNTVQTDSSSDRKDDKNDDKNGDRSDDRSDSKKDTDDKKVDDTDDKTNDKTDDIIEDKTDDKNNNNNDDKNDGRDNNVTDSDDVKAQIIGIWHYGWPIDCYFEFFEDGTWDLDSDGGSWNRGTYKIEDGKTIRMEGEAGNLTFTIRNADELSDEDGETLTRFVRRHDDNFNEPADEPDDPDDRSDSGKVSRHPVFTVEEFGNFREIYTAIFEISDCPAEETVGRWYEDGWLEGYYLELYGNGTWRYYGEDERNGYFRIGYRLGVLEESEFGVDVCMPIIFYDEDKKAYMMSLTVIGPEAFKTRTDPEDYVCFIREDFCKHCKDLDDYYEKKYPYKELAGDWYPVGDHSGKFYFKITAAAHWADVRGHGVEEVGVLEEDGEGSFTSIGGTYGKLRTFKLADDGYLYIDGEAYEKDDPGSTPPIRSLGTFCYESGDGYTFYEDWTFESVPGSSFDEHGTFLFIGDNLLLYDDNGYRLHVLYQDEFMDWDGVLKEEAWMKRMENRDDSDLYGEALYFVIPSED